MLALLNTEIRAVGTRAASAIPREVEALDAQGLHSTRLARPYS
jgi:hypothetical protein